MNSTLDAGPAVNMMAEQPGAPFQFSADGDNMEISSPHMFHDQDIDIDLELGDGDGEEAAGEDENMLEDAPTSDFLTVGDAEPLSVDDEMADDMPTPKQEENRDYAFGAADFQPEPNDLDLIDDAVDFSFDDFGRQEVDQPNDLDFAAGSGEQENVFQQEPRDPSLHPQLESQTNEDTVDSLEPPTVGAAMLEHSKGVEAVEISEVKLSQDHTTLQSSEVEGQSCTVPGSQASLDHTDLSAPELTDHKSMAPHNSLDDTLGLSANSDAQALARFGEDDVPEEPYAETEKGQGQYEVTLEGDSSHETSPGDQALHPVVVKYQSEEMSLFQSRESEIEHSPTFLLQDQTLASQSILELLEACRDVLAGSVDDAEELILGLDVLGLEFCESTPESSITTLTEILDIYLQLNFNDGINLPEPLITTLGTRARLADRLELLRATASDGGGMSTVAYLTYEEGVIYGNKDEEQRLVQDDADQTPPGHETAQPEIRLDNDGVVDNNAKANAATEKPRPQLDTSPKDESEDRERDFLQSADTPAEAVAAKDAQLGHSRLGSLSLQGTRRDSNSKNSAEAADNGKGNGEVDVSDVEIHDPEHDNGLGSRGSDHSNDLGKQNVEDNDDEQDFELNFNQTTAAAEAPSDLTRTNPLDADLNVSANSEPNGGFERRGSSSGSSTVKGNTAAVNRSAVTKPLETNLEDFDRGTAAHGNEISDLGAADYRGLLETNGEEDELTWDEDEELPPYSYNQTNATANTEHATDTSNITFQNDPHDGLLQSAAPKVSMNGTSVTENPDYDSDEITYDDEELDAPLAALGTVASRNGHQESLKGGSASIKRGRTSAEEFDHDRFEGQGEAKRVKSV